MDYFVTNNSWVEIDQDNYTFVCYGDDAIILTKDMDYDDLIKYLSDNDLIRKCDGCSDYYVINNRKTNRYIYCEYCTN